MGATTYKTTLITTLCIVLDDREKSTLMGDYTITKEQEGINSDYIQYGKKMVESYLEHTPYDVLIVTNKPHEFEGYGDRLIIEYMPTSAVDTTYFKYTLKLDAIAIGYEKGYDVTYWVDCDCYTEGWDDESFQELVNTDVDLYHTYIVNCEYLHQKNCGQSHLIKRDVFPGDSEYVHSTREDRLIFPHRESLGKMVKLWQDYDLWNDMLDLKGTRVGKRDGHWTRWEEVIGCDGILIAEAGIMAKAKMSVTPFKCEFAQHERSIFRHNGEVLDRWWCHIFLDEDHRRGIVDSYHDHDTYRLVKGWSMKDSGWVRKQ